MRFLVSCLIAVTLVAAALPALAARKENRDISNHPQTKEHYLTTQAVKEEPVDHLGLSAIYSADILQKSLAVMGNPSLQAAPAPAAVPRQEALEALTYEPSSEVERATRQKLQASLLATTKTAAVQDQIRLTIKSDDFWRQFDAILTKAGFSSRNIADVTAAYYIISWEVVNSNETDATTASIQAVRDAVVGGMAADQRFAKMSDAEKQEAASVLAYMATVAANSVNLMHSAGDNDGLVRLREQVHDNIMKQGVDLDRLRLTDEGFVAR